MFGLAGAKLIAYGLALAAIIGAITWSVHTLKQSGRDEANAACLINAVKEAEAARNLVDQVKAEAKAESEKAEAERQRKYAEDDERRSREDAQRSSALADKRSLMQKSSPDCKQWRSELYLCATQ